MKISECKLTNIIFVYLFIQEDNGPSLRGKRHTSSKSTIKYVIILCLVLKL